MIRAAMTLTWISLVSLRTLWLGMILAKISQWCLLTMASLKNRGLTWRSKGQQTVLAEIQSTYRRGIACWITFQAAGTRRTGPRDHLSSRDNRPIRQSCPCRLMRTSWVFRQVVRQLPSSKLSTRVLKIMCTYSIINLEYGMSPLYKVARPVSPTVIFIIIYDNLTG